MSPSLLPSASLPAKFLTPRKPCGYLQKPSNHGHVALMDMCLHTHRGALSGYERAPGFPMLDGQQLKTLGLRFARALHMTIKTAIMFTVEHKSVERPIQQSFQLLNLLLKEAGQFTFGFV